MIRRLAHLCFTTNDVERLVAFYRDGLGLSVKFRFAAADGEIFGAYIDVGDSSFIEVFDQHRAAKQWGGKLDPLVAGSRYGHVCLEVTGLADFCQTLLTRGVSVGELRSGLDGSLQAWLTDPDGNSIELMEYTHHSAQLEPGSENTVWSSK